MVDEPGDFSHFIKTCASVDDQYRQMEVKCSGKSTGQGDAPHADDQTVHVKKRIAAGGEDPVDDHGTDTTSDHVDREDDKHADHVFMCLIREFHETGNKRNTDQNDRRGEESDQHNIYSKAFCGSGNDFDQFLLDVH